MNTTSQSAPHKLAPSDSTKKAENQFSPLLRSPAYLKVYEAIEAEILAGHLEEGVLIPTEASLCEQFGVTRSTVREGIRLLETSGLVVRGAGKRLVVQRPSTSDVAASTSKALTFSGVTVREAIEALSLFQPEIAAIVAQKISKEEIEQLKIINRALLDTPKTDFDKIVFYTDKFFTLLGKNTNNGVTNALSLSLNRLINAGLALVISNVDDARKRIAQAQWELIVAFENNDSQRARIWMSRHIEDLQRGYEVADFGLDAPIV